MNHPIWMLEAALGRRDNTVCWLQRSARTTLRAWESINRALDWPKNLIVAVNYGTVFDMSLTDSHLKGLDSALMDLSERDRDMLLAYYKEQLTYREVASRYGLTSERIRQIVQRSIGQLRSPSGYRKIMYGYDYAERYDEVSKRLASLSARERHLASLEASLIAHEQWLRAKDAGEDPREFASKTHVRLSDAELRQIYNTPLAELGLSTRPLNGLKKRACKTLGDVIVLAREGQLAQIPNLGISSVREILEVIENRTGISYIEQNARDGGGRTWKI